jgi:PTS system nitrogen regulatory IIA component
MDISDILSPERTICDVSSSSKKAALEILASLIASADSALSQTDVFMGLMAREKLGSTGLGKGIALPHGRLSGVGSALGAFVKLQQPINYDAIDGAPVDVLFALVVPEEATDEHLKILSLLAQTFSNDEILQKIRQTSSRDDVFKLLCVND